MRLRAAALLALAALACLAFWATGGLAALTWWLAGQQRALQGALAGEITALRAGGGAALWSLMGLCAAYGFLHAMGPGHGKALIAGAAVGSRATARRMALIALAGSLAQAGVAIAVVYGGLALVGATARGLSEGAERWAQSAGALAVALIGAWLLARGLLALRRAVAPPATHDEHRDCGHHHGPSAEEAAGATGLAAALALVAGMAARPCTGAILILVIAWRMQLAWAGAGAVVAMGLGAAGFTALVAWLAVTSREAAILSAGPGGAARLLAPGLQILAGGAILAVACLTLLGTLSGGAPV